MQEAYLICKLYKKLGPCMVSKLQGDFAFVLHDSHMVSTQCVMPSVYLKMSQSALQEGSAELDLWTCNRGR